MSYEQPQVIDLGKIEDLTEALGTPGNLDASFPAGTPFGDLTFT